MNLNRFQIVKGIIIVFAIFSSISTLAAQTAVGSGSSGVNACAEVAKGVISGKVLNENGAGILDAKVFVNGETEAVATTDIEGVFVAKVKVGQVNLLIELDGYVTKEDSIKVSEGVTAYYSCILNKIERGGAVDIKVKKAGKPNTAVGAIQTKMLSLQMVEAISAEDMGRTAIRTTSDALKRIPGATISEGKFANVRGMFDRYNAGYLNGAPLPSTESDRKAFSFDVIPAGLLDGIVVIKSATPDLVGDFGGGVIKINTKSIPEKFSQSVSFGFQYNTITTGKSLRAFAMDPANYLGVMSKSQQIPTLDAAMKTDYIVPEFNVEQTKKFDNNWNIGNYTAPVSPRFSYTVGKPFKIKKMDAGMMLSYNYSMTQRFTEGLVQNMEYSDNHLVKRFNDSSVLTNVQNGGVANFSLKINKRNRLDFKNLYSLTYDASSTVRAGLVDAENQNYGEGFSNMVNLNRLISSQLNGIHAVGKEGTLNWLVNLGTTKRQIPDFRIAQYSVPENDRTARNLIYNQFFYAGSGRFFSTLFENTVSASVDYSKNVKVGKIENMFKTGFFSQYRTRSFDSRQFAYGPLSVSGKFSQEMPDKDLGDGNISAAGTYLIEKTRNDKDDYTAFSNNNALYAMMETRIPMFKSAGKVYDLKLIYGARLELFKQQLKNRYLTQIGKLMADPAATSDLLPSLNVILPLTTKSNFRAAYYKTLNRPELRELAPFSFYNFNINSEVLGFTDLKRAIIDNVDIRWERYSNKQDMISLGAFYKRILNPIEFRLETSQSLIRTFTYQNEQVATNYGLELELRKNLGSFIQYLGWSWLKNFTFYANGALIRSEVEFGDGYKRTLQGQSPFVVNASLFYENKNGLQVNASFNKIGPRIAYIGVPMNVQPFGANIYEFGRSILDLQISKNITKSSVLKVTCGDLLAQQTVFYQDLDYNPKQPAVRGNGKFDNKPYDDATKTGDNTLFSYTNGRTITFSYIFNF